MYTFETIDSRPKVTFKVDPLAERLAQRGFGPSTLLDPSTGANRIAVEGSYQDLNEFYDELANEFSKLGGACEHQLHVSYNVQRLSMSNEPPVDLICEAEQEWYQNFNASGTYVSIVYSVLFWEACPEDCIL